MTQDPIERTKLNSFCLFCSGIGGVSCSVLVPFLSERLGTTPQTGYQRTMIVISIIMVISYLTTSFFCKERVPEVKTNDSEGSLTLSDVLEMFKKNRPLLILIAMYLAAYTFNIVISSVGTYFVTYNLEGKISVGIWSLLQTLPSIIPMLFVPALAAKVGKKMVVQTGGIIGIIGAAIVYVMPSASLVGLCIGKGIGALGYGMAIAAIWSTMPDTVEYGEYVIGKRAGGLIFSLATFSIKLALAIAGIVPTIVFSIVEYVPNGVQTAECLEAIKIMNSIMPGIILLVGVIIYSRYSLTEKRYADIVEILADRRKEANKV